MSMAVNSASTTSSALSYLQSLMQQGTSGAGNSDPLSSLMQDTSAPVDGPAAVGGSGPPFDTNSLGTLLGAQEGSAGGGQGAAASSGGGGAGGAGGASGADDGSDSSTNADGSTTQDVTNPDGSVTTTTTYPDGTVQVSTTPPVVPAMQGGLDLLKQLGDLLAPATAAATTALLI